MEPLQILMAFVVFTLMLGLGATCTVDDFKNVYKSPKAPAIGFVSQFVIMPLLGFSIAKMFSVPDEQGLSMVMIASTPGGVTSNLFSYYGYGDVSLSIACTVVSTVCAFGMMPFLIWLLGREFTGDDVEIPFSQIVVSVALTLIPTAIGVLVKSKSDVWAKRCEKVASILGILFILAAIVVGCIDNTEIFNSGWEMWISAILLLPCGASLGYGLSVLSGLSAKAARTVALETGIQNTTLTIAVIVFAYPRGEEGDVGYEAAKDLQDKLLAFPLMFSLFLIITACLMTLLFRHIASEEDKKSSEEIAQEKAEKEKEEVENNTI